MTTHALLLIQNKEPKMVARYMLFFKVFINSCLRRGDADALTGTWSKLFKLEDGRTNYDAEMFDYTQLVLDGKVHDEHATKLLQGATIVKDAAGLPVDIAISEASLAAFDGLEIHSKVTMETMANVNKLQNARHYQHG